MPTSSESLHFHYEKIHKYKNISLKFIPNPSPCIRKDTPCTPFSQPRKILYPKSYTHSCTQLTWLLYTKTLRVVAAKTLLLYTKKPFLLLSLSHTSLPCPLHACSTHLYIASNPSMHPRFVCLPTQHIYIYIYMAAHMLLVQHTHFDFPCKLSTKSCKSSTCFL